MELQQPAPAWILLIPVRRIELDHFPFDFS